MNTLQAVEIEQAREYFRRTQDRVVEVTKGLTEAQWKFKPAPDRWSIAQNLEHMVIVRERVLGRLRDQLLQAPPPADGVEERAIGAIVLEKIPERAIQAQ